VLIGSAFIFARRGSSTLTKTGCCSFLPARALPPHSRDARDAARTRRAFHAARGFRVELGRENVRRDDAWVLKNVGPKTKDHLDEDDEVVTPGDLPLTSPRMVVGRAASESVSLEIAVPTVRCVLYTGPHTTALAW
jgi:hypothetical protein